MKSTEASKPKVYIIVLNWNRAGDTCACVESLLQLDYGNYEIVICDNASRIDSLADIRAWATSWINKSPATTNFFREFDTVESYSRERIGEIAAQITLIHTGGNLGYAGGMNVGMRYALVRHDMDFVWILNNDAVVDRQALGELVVRGQCDPTIGICGSSLVYFEDRNKVQAYGGAAYQPWRGQSKAIGAFSHVNTIPSDPGEVEKKMAYVIGASMLVTHRFIDKVGLMDETYFLYSEEQDWAFKGREVGFRMGYAPKSFVYHKHGATIGTSPKGGSTLSLFYLYRAKLMFSSRHYSWLLPLVYGSLVWDAIKFTLKGHPDKALAVLNGMAAAASGRGPA
jgi:GT2 family glycosyltransferase